jgi:transcriptional regulator with XRE-family HTH domain
MCKIRKIAEFFRVRHSLAMDITCAQCRAARALLDISQDDLAQMSRVSKRTITHFESGKRALVPATLMAIKQALETAGVRFTTRGVEFAVLEDC